MRFQAAELFAAGWLGQLEGYPVGCEVWRGTSLLLAFKVSGKVVNKWVGSSPAAVRGAVEGRRRHIKYLALLAAADSVKAARVDLENKLYLLTKQASDCVTCSIKSVEQVTH